MIKSLRNHLILTWIGRYLRVDTILVPLKRNPTVRWISISASDTMGTIDETALDPGQQSFAGNFIHVLVCLRKTGD